MHNKMIISAIIIFILSVCLINNSYAAGTIFSGGDDFITSGERTDIPNTK